MTIDHCKNQSLRQPSKNMNGALIWSRKLKVILLYCIVGSGLSLSATHPVEGFGSRDVTPLQFDWKFSLSDQAGASKPDHDDSDWETVRITLLHLVFQKRPLIRSSNPT